MTVVTSSSERNGLGVRKEAIGTMWWTWLREAFSPSMPLFGPVKMTIDDNLTRGARLSRLFSPTSSAHPRCKAADEP